VTNAGSLDTFAGRVTRPVPRNIVRVGKWILNSMKLTKFQYNKYLSCFLTHCIDHFENKATYTVYFQANRPNKLSVT
jgi:hypothetical protein